MSKNKIRKEKIFDLYSKNLEFVKKHPQIVLEPNLPNSYICPLCFNAFSKLDLSDDSENSLTIEHVPPRKMGGKPLILTCKTCNSTAGHELDSHLLHVLQHESFKNFQPNSKLAAVYEKDGRRMNGEVKIDQTGTLIMNLISERSNPEHSNYILDQLSLTTRRLMDYEAIVNYSPQPINLNFSVKSAGKQVNAEISLLRIAYLLAFSKFGYGWLINGNLFKIRDQIQNPNKAIINNPFWLKYDFTDDYIGVNIICMPREMTSFLVVFKLKTESFDRNFAIVLPGPNDPGLKVYDFIRDHLFFDEGKMEMLDCSIQPFADINFITHEKYAFASHILWQSMLDENQNIDKI